LRAFLGARSDSDSEYYFLSSFLLQEETRADNDLDQLSFTGFVRELDSHFAPASASETSELLLERAKSVTLSANRTLSALLKERLQAVERAGTYSEAGLYEYVRSALSEIIEGLTQALELRGMLRNIEVAFDQTARFGGSRREADRLIGQLQAFESSRAGRGAWKAYWEARATSSASSGAAASAAKRAAAGARPEGTGRGVFPLSAEYPPALVLQSYGSPLAPEFDSQSVLIVQGDGGRKPSLLLKPGNFDDLFVVNEGVPGQPSPLDASRFGPGAQRCFLTKIKDIAIALGKGSLVPKLPKDGEDFICSGLLCPGCDDRSPQNGWYVHKRYPDHAPLRDALKHLERDPGPGVRFYHSIGSCPFLWKRLHQFVKAHPERVDLFEHTKGTAPPTRCVVIEQPCTSSA
jgi:hypothetical protein